MQSLNITLDSGKSPCIFEGALYLPPQKLTAFNNEVNKGLFGQRNLKTKLTNYVAQNLCFNIDNNNKITLYIIWSSDFPKTHKAASGCNKSQGFFKKKNGNLGGRGGDLEIKSEVGGGGNVCHPPGGVVFVE